MLQTLVQVLHSIRAYVDKVILNWLVVVWPLELLELADWVRREGLLALRPLRLYSADDVIFSIKTVGLRRENEIVIDVHQASDSFQKVRRRSPSNNEPSIISSLSLSYLLTTTV